MIGEIIKTVLIPKNESDWVLIQTNNGFYSFRLGGFRFECQIDNVEKYKTLDCPYSNEPIKEVYTDDEWVYLLVGENGVIISGWINIDSDGEMNLGIKFSNRNEFEYDFFESEDLYQLTLNSDGWSKKI